ncbi:MAG: hypothetical protein LQ346_001952 [Caloplaca aetnensis]|nr:MAG: hypothetical protein LQ346_001952 [Caloplaca aetnensis]
MASQECISNIPVCLVIFGGMRATPELVNVSVGIPLYATAAEAVILFRDTQSQKVYVVAAKGAFSPLAKVPNHIDLNQWENLTSFDDDAALIEACQERGIQITCSSDRRDTSAVSLGKTWDSSTGCLVDVDRLLQERTVDPQDLVHLLEDEAFQQLALVCKTRHRITELRSFLVRHKQEEIIVRLEDTHGARNILQRLRETDTTENEREDLTAKLRQAHAANRQSYLTEKNCPSKEVQAMKQLNRTIDRALSGLSEMEKAGYTADILSRKSNRARRADALTFSDAEIHLSGLDLSDHVKASRGACSICCGENEIMSIVLKRLDSVEENTSDFFLNFPLVVAQAQQNADMISSQCICFQCATLIGSKSIFQEDLSAILPVVDYLGENKQYINHQLTMAITAGLATGAAGIVQMFMSILDNTLETKKWCSFQADIQRSDPEVSLRRQTLVWMLNNLLRTCITRERFSDETSRWVEYPMALSWAVEDWKVNKLNSWIIQYPVKGFNQLMRWYKLLREHETRVDLGQIMVTKLLNVVVSTFLAQLLRNRGNRDWIHPFMQLIYKCFNATNVPRDLADQSVVTSIHFWARLEAILGAREDGKQLLAGIPGSSRPSACRRLQLVIFWAIFTQKEHVTAKGFFHRLLLREALAATVLDPTSWLPDEQLIQSTLRSIFIAEGQATDAAHEGPPPFVTPFGPSVISCGKAQCAKLFYDPDKPETLHPDLVRKRRAEHLNSVFQPGSFNDTGLPDPVNEPDRPNSTHYTLHMSVVKVWSALPRSRKEAGSDSLIQRSGAAEVSKEDLINGEAVAEFVTRAREHICAESHRGNVYHSDLEREVRELLPSFLEALRVASEKCGLEDTSGLSYIHDWTSNKLADKITYELSLTMQHK